MTVTHLSVEPPTPLPSPPALELLSHGGRGSPQLLWLCNPSSKDRPTEHGGLGVAAAEIPPTERSPWKSFQVCRLCEPLFPRRWVCQRLLSGEILEACVRPAYRYLAWVTRRLGSQLSPPAFPAGLRLSGTGMRQLLAATRQGYRPHGFPVRVRT